MSHFETRTVANELIWSAEIEPQIELSIEPVEFAECTDLLAS